MPDLTPSLEAAVQAALQDMRDGVDYPALLAALEAGDIAAVEKALDFEQGSWAPYIAAAMVIYMQTGAEAARRLPIRFDPTRDADFRADVNAKVAAYTDEQIVKAREYVYNGYAAGRSRRDIAQGLAGKVSKLTGKRQGGVIGLSGAQQSWVDKMRERLESGDPEQMRAVLTAKERDKRFDRTIKRAIVEARKSEKDVAKAIVDGKPMPAIKPPVLDANKIDDITGKYADRLLRKRAKDIASTEATQFASGARADAVRQALAKVPGATATKTWHHSSIYINARPDHVGMSGVTVAFDANFVMADGVPMRYAHDPRGGAKHNASCRCRTTYAIKWPDGVK